MDTPTIVQLMIAERLNVIAGNLADVQDRLSEVVNRMPGY
jgi:pheromone shutdown protein TraB